MASNSEFSEIHAAMDSTIIEKSSSKAKKSAPVIGANSVKVESRNYISRALTEQFLHSMPGEMPNWKEVQTILEAWHQFVVNKIVIGEKVVVTNFGTYERKFVNGRNRKDMRSDLKSSNQVFVKEHFKPHLDMTKALKDKVKDYDEFAE